MYTSLYRFIFALLRHVYQIYRVYTAEKPVFVRFGVHGIDGIHDFGRGCKFYFIGFSAHYYDNGGKKNTGRGRNPFPCR